MSKARVAIIMGSQNDWDTMRPAEEALEKLGIACDVRVISAHRTPDRLTAYLGTAEEEGIEVIISRRRHAASSCGNSPRRAARGSPTAPASSSRARPAGSRA